MTREELIFRGEAAARLLDDPLAMRALSEIGAECVASWAGSNPADAAAREDAYRLHRCVGLFRQKLETWAANAALEKGNMAARAKDERAGLIMTP